LADYNKFLVLGSSGLIGKHLKLYLEKLGKVVLVFDIVNNQKQDLRIQDNFELNECISNVDFVFFLAFDVGGSKYLTNLDKNEQFLVNNTSLLLNTFTSLSKHKKPFIFTSTYLVNDLNNNYSLLKCLGERFSNTINGLSVRLWNIYGFESVSERSHLIPDLIYQAKELGKINLLTNGLEKKQFLYVDDCCEGLYEIAMRFNDLKKFEIIDLSSFDWTTVYKVGQIISEIFSCQLSKSSNSSFLSPNVNPQKNVLEFWKPKTGLKEGILKIINIYENSINNRS
jgi:nucleoside-diphosphate-sugar epimerase